MNKNIVTQMVNFPSNMTGFINQTQGQMMGFNPNFNEGNIGLNMTQILLMKK